MVRSNLLSGGFTWEEVMEFVEEFGAKVNKCSYMNEYINFFL